jgi:hypothetical protein
MWITKSVAAALSSLAMTCLSAGLAHGALTDNLVAYYPLEDGSGFTAGDAVGVNNGMLSGNFAGTEWTTGKIGDGLQFTRTGQTGTNPGGWIAVPGLLSNNVLADGGSYTFSAWVNAAEPPGTNNFGTVIWGANTDGTNSNHLRVGVNPSNAGPGLARGATRPIPGTEDVNLIGTGWHLVTMSMDAAGEADFYIDGNFEATLAGTREQIWSTADSFYFGMEPDGTGTNAATDPFHGTLDELAIWNRELSASEIAELYNNGDGVSLLASSAAGVPEPSTLAMLSLLAFGYFGGRRRRRRNG